MASAPNIHRARGARLQGRVALVTGAASGIGRATSLRFAEEGATVVLADRDADKLAEALADLPSGDHLSRVLDVTDETVWANLAAELETGFGRLDVLVNNAGFGTFRSIADTTLDHWRAIRTVNLDSLFLSGRAMLPLLARAEAGGSIINMSSIRGIAAAANTGSYCAAKGGARNFTKALALEWADAGIRVNSIHPGHVLTPLTAGAHADPATSAHLLADTPLGRPATPREIADAMLFLASDDSRYMTGAELVVDGGATAQ